MNEKAKREPTAFVRFINTRPQIPGYEEAGTEPSLKAMVREYYRKHIDDEVAVDNLTDLYMHVMIDHFSVHSTNNFDIGYDAAKADVRKETTEKVGVLRKQLDELERIVKDSHTFVKTES